MIGSFRLRLFLVATVIVAGVLALVMASGWQQALNFETHRLDVRLCSEAQRLALEHFAASELPRLEVDIMGKLHLAAPDQLLLRVDSAPNQESYRSERWDATMAQQALHWQTADDAIRAVPARRVPALQSRPDKPDRPDRPAPPTDTARNDNPPSLAASTAAPGCALVAFSFQDDNWRAARALQGETLGTVAANLTAPSAEISAALGDALLLEVPLALVLTALGAWLLSRLAMRPVNRLRDAMKAVTPQGLDTRLPDTGEDLEFKELIAAYNTMLARLERSFQQASRFSANAAHELKTPLTILRGRLEQLRSSSGNNALQADLAQLQDEVSRLSAITRKLLLLSQADAGRIELSLAPLDMSELLELLAADARMLAPDRVLNVQIERGLLIQGDAVLIRQLLNNLLSNALRYTPGGGTIVMQARRVTTGIEIRVNNSCLPLSATDRTHFFERFYRADAARNRQHDGNGLGLSLALEIAKAHGGTLALLPGPATEVSLLLKLPNQGVSLE